AAELPRYHERECETADDRDHDNEARVKPVVDKAAIEHDLERAKKRCHEHEANQIEPTLLPQAPPRLCYRRRRLAQDRRDQRDREEADGPIYEKTPVPRPIFSEPAAESGADHRSDDD